MVPVIRHELVLEDGRFLSLTYRVPGTWFLQAFISEESARAEDPPLLAVAEHVPSDEAPSGADYLSPSEAAAVLEKWLPRFLEHWDTTRAQLGIDAGAVRR